MSAVYDLVINLMAKSSQFSASMTAARGSISAVSRTADAASAQIGSMGRMLAGALGIAGVGATVAKTIGLAQAQEKAERKLAATLEATGHAAGFTAAQLQKYAADLQRATNFGDEVIVNAQAIMATFRNVRGDEFNRATALMLDMAAVMDGDLKGSAIQLGKALNDPIKGVSALSEVGVSFTAQQKAQIAAMVEAGNVAGAQGVILDELAGEFGGAAAAMADPAVQAKNLIGDVGEEIGRQILPMLRALGEAALQAGDWLTRFGGSAGGVVSQLIKYAAAAAAAKLAVMAVSAAIRIYTMAQKAAAAATIVTQMLLGPAGWVKVGAGIAAAGLAIYGMNSMLDASSAKFATTGAAGVTAMDGVTRGADNAAGSLAAAADGAWEVGDALAALGSVVQPVREGLDGLSDLIGDPWKGAKKGIQAADEAMAGFREQTATAGMDDVDKQIWKLQQMGVDDAYLKQVQDVGNEWRRVNDEMEAAREKQKQLEAQIAAGESLTEQVRTPVEAALAEIERINELAKSGMIDETTRDRAVMQAKAGATSGVIAESPAEAARKKVQEIQDLYGAGLIDDATRRQGIDDQIGKLEGDGKKGGDDYQGTAALERGSAEAYSRILAAMYGGGGKDKKDATEKHTKETAEGVKAIIGVLEAIRDNEVQELPA